jgi:hypothetical protein
MGMYSIAVDDLFEDGETISVSTSKADEKKAALSQGATEEGVARCGTSSSAVATQPTATASDASTPHPCGGDEIDSVDVPVRALGSEMGEAKEAPAVSQSYAVL